MYLVLKNNAGAIFACYVVALFMFAGVFCGCAWFSDEKREEIKDKIVELIETKGQDAALEYIDKLVEDGRLGATNAEDIKAAIPQGIEKVKEILEAEK